MEIKKNLKNLDIKISKFATDLGISRPTLDNYIDYFDNGVKIPNDIYQRVFEYLFSKENINSIEFAERYDYVKRVMLNDAKEKAELNAYSKKHDAIVKNIVDLLNSNTIDEELINFINLFMNNKDKDLVKAIYKYFNFTNGFINVESENLSELDKALYSQLALLFSNYLSNNIEFNEDSYNEFLNKNKKLYDSKRIKINDSDIVEYIKNNLNDSSNIDFEVLKEMIALREGNNVNK